MSLDCDTITRPRIFTRIQGRDDLPRVLPFDYSDDPRSRFASFYGLKQAISELWKLRESEMMSVTSLQVVGADFDSPYEPMLGDSSDKEWHLMHRRLRRIKTDCTITLALPLPKAEFKKAEKSVQTDAGSSMGTHAEEHAHSQHEGKSQPQAEQVFGPAGDILEQSLDVKCGVGCESRPHSALELAQAKAREDSKVVKGLRKVVETTQIEISSLRVEQHLVNSKMTQLKVNSARRFAELEALFQVQGGELAGLKARSQAA